MPRTLDQQIAEAENRIARLKARRKAAETRRKIIVGSVVITEALADPDLALRIARILRNRVSREVDRKVVADLLVELDAKGAEE